jgi:peptide/nickel transport system substrate-binding protein
LDPARAYEYFGWEIIQSLGCGLVEYKAGATGSIDDIVPSLATSWNVSDDGLVWTFNLRQGVHYDDGSEFNATHVKYTFDRGIGIADADSAFVGIGYDGIISNVTVTDKYIVKFYLKIPFAAFLSLMACQASYIVDPAHAPMTSVVEYTAGNARASHPMGLGPYTLASWTRTAGHDTEMQLQANTNYWNTSGGYPRAKNITVKFYADSTGLALAIKAQPPDIDIAFRQLGATDINDMKTNTNLKVWEGTGAFIQYLVLQGKYAPFNNTIIRQAVGAAINRTTIVDTVFRGQAQKLYSMIPIGLFGHTDAFLTLGDPNYTKTLELLADLGYNETHKLSFKLWYETSGHYPSSPEQAQVLKSSLEASGVISVTLDSADWASFRSHRQNEDMEAYILGWYPDYIDPDDYIQPFLDSSGGSWLHNNYNSTQMDKLIAWARGNTTAAARSNLYSQIQNLMVQDCPIIPLYQGSAYAVTSLTIAGVFLDMTQHLRYWLIYPPGPTITVLQPESMVYSSNLISLDFVVDRPTSWIGYSLDSATNVTIEGNVTLANLSDGLHLLVVYANDTLDNMGSSAIIYFSVDTTGPNITDLSQIPPGQTITQDDKVAINATISDQSGVKQATLVYSYLNSSGGPWIEAISMAHLLGNTWNATIPAYPQGTNITYSILAEDNVGNAITTQELGYYYQYSVIPEFPTFFAVAVLMTATLFVVTTRKKRHEEKG